MPQSRRQGTEILAALRAGENDALSRPCRATLPHQVGEGKANAFAEFTAELTERTVTAGRRS
jgi:hypothetical protein